MVLAENDTSGRSFRFVPEPAFALAGLLVLSCSLVFVTRWAGIALVLFASWAYLFVSRTPAHGALKFLVPLAPLLAFSLLANSLSLSAAPRPVPADVAAHPLFAGPPVELGLGWWFDPVSFSHALFVVARVLVLFWLTYLAIAPYDVDGIVSGLRRLMKPLARVGVPVEDVATICAIALRFIPECSRELVRVRDAQASRAAPLYDGSALTKLKAWSCVMTPMFLGLFRRADVLARAMEARCFGAGERTELPAPGTAAAELAAGDVAVSSAVSRAASWGFFVLCVALAAASCVLFV